MGNAKKFFEELAKTEEAKALFTATGQPETEEARVAAYIDVAAKLGVVLTAEEINEYYASSCTSDAQEIDDQELEQLSGGGAHPACNSSYIKGENCIFADHCNHLWQDYNATSDARAENKNQKVWDQLTLDYYQLCMHPSVMEKYDEVMASIGKK